MFVKNSSYEDFSRELESNLQKAERQPLVEKMARESTAIEHLIKAANLLDQEGFETQAAEITNLLEKISWHVPAVDTAGLTSEKMVENLKNKGWVFNADDGVDVDGSGADDEKADVADAADGEVLEVVEPEADEKVELQPDGDIEVTAEIEHHTVDNTNEERWLSMALSMLKNSREPKDIFHFFVSHKVPEHIARWAVKGAMYLYQKEIEAEVPTRRTHELKTLEDEAPDTVQPDTLPMHDPASDDPRDREPVANLGEGNNYARQRSYLLGY